MRRPRPLRSQAELLLAGWPALYERLLRLRPGHDLDRRVFLHLVRRGDVVFDVGANLGLYTLLFSHLAGRSGRVHAFEPAPPTFAALVRRLESEGRFHNLIVNGAAVGAAAGTVSLYLPGEDHGQASLAPQTGGSWAGEPRVTEFTVPVTTLDAYAAARNVDAVHLVKCDVEGAELGVLQGGAGLLARDHPLLHLEVSHQWARAFGYGPEEVVSLLSGLGYGAFYHLQGEVRLLRDPAAELAGLREGGSANLLCAVPELHAERLRAIVGRPR
jgi:FkbM family methyltransferase